MKIITDREHYTKLWKRHSLHLLQSWEWGEVKRGTWEPVRIEIEGFPIQILKRKVPITGKEFGYLPRPFTNSTITKSRVKKLITFSLESKFSHIVVDPNVSKKSLKTMLHDTNFYVAGETVQPNQTNKVYLHKSEENLWMGLKGKYRRNIKKSSRQNCKIEIYDNSENAVERFYKVMESIFSRTSYIMFGLEYFQKVWSILSEAGYARIFIATKDGRDVGAYFVGYDNIGAYELYGGVTDAGRDVEAGYLLKWEAIKDAKQQRKEIYDHWGIAPVKDGEYDKTHELYHISKFKEGFGGEIEIFLPQQIIVFDPFSYFLYATGKNINSIILNIKKFGRK